MAAAAGQPETGLQVQVLPGTRDLTWPALTCNYDEHSVEKSESNDFRGVQVVQCFPGKSAKDPVTFKTLESSGCDSLWQNNVK